MPSKFAGERQAVAVARCRNAYRQAEALRTIDKRALERGPNVCFGRVARTVTRASNETNLGGVVS